MANIPFKLKEEIFNLVLSQENAFGEIDHNRGILPFLELVWDLRSMPSEDERYDNAYRDIFQHTVQFNDLPIEDLFLKRLRLFENDDHFCRWLEAIVSPRIRGNADEIYQYVHLINPFLDKADLTFLQEDYDGNGLPIFRIKDPNQAPFEDSAIQNNIPFFVASDLSGQSNWSSSHTRPPEYPSFVLAYNSGWNDFDYQTYFDLFYYANPDFGNHVGGLKIGFEEAPRTIDHIPPNFTMLGDSFYSIGLSEGYYSSLKNLLDSERLFREVLYALRDTAIFPSILEENEIRYVFRASLLRWDVQERLVRQVRYSIYGFDLNRLYSFKYLFNPTYSQDTIEVSFDFNNDLPSLNRIIAFIGKNGTGKTQLITKLPLDISNEKKASFNSLIPRFSKVIAVSYSIFDKFPIPKKSAAFNYVYCGLKKPNDQEYSERGLLNRFHNSWKQIKRVGRIGKWQKILLTFLEDDMVNSFIVEESNPENEEHSYTVSKTGFQNVRQQLSSGQAIILFVVTEIVANIRLDSLLLFDELETHLHPNAITQLMNIIFSLVTEFESYCVIATHSPLVVCELLSKNVFVVERHETVPSIRRPGIETFGTEISTIIDEVFGNRDIPKQHMIIVENMVREGMDFQTIIGSLESHGIPLSLRIRLHIKLKIQHHNAQS